MHSYIPIIATLMGGFQNTMIPHLWGDYPQVGNFYVLIIGNGMLRIELFILKIVSTKILEVANDIAIYTGRIRM